MPYVEITLAMMRDFGVEVAREGDTFVVPPGGYRATDYAIEPDASTASYFFAAAALAGGRSPSPAWARRAPGRPAASSRCCARWAPRWRSAEDATTVTGTGGLRGVTVNMRDISDTMPTLAAIAPFADGPVRIEDVYNTRVKECDRLEACAENLRAAGRRGRRPAGTGSRSSPGTPRAGEIACHGDHRMAMSFAVAGLRTPGTTFDDPDVREEDLPGLPRVLRGPAGRLGRLTGRSAGDAPGDGPEPKKRFARCAPI